MSLIAYVPFRNYTLFPLNFTFHFVFAKRKYDPCLHSLSFSLSLRKTLTIQIFSFYSWKAFVKQGGSHIYSFINDSCFFTEETIEINGEWSSPAIFLMDGMYGFHSAGDYSDKAVLMMSPDNLLFSSDYQALLCSSAGDNRVSDVFGSDELLSAAASALSSEAASIAPEIRRRNDDNVSISVIKSKIACHPSYPRLLQAYIDCQKVIYQENYHWWFTIHAICVLYFLFEVDFYALPIAYASRIHLYIVSSFISRTLIILKELW